MSFSIKKKTIPLRFTGYYRHAWIISAFFLKIEYEKFKQVAIKGCLLFLCLERGNNMENTNIAKKLLAVMADCAYVAKNGINSFHKYKYATAEDVLQKVNESLVKNKIVSIASPDLQQMVDVTNLKGNTEHLATVIVKIQLIDSESGESVIIVGIGSGQDAGDKAVMKAQTAAIKYAYMLSLCIATGDDPEADAKTDENNADITQKKVLKANAESTKVNTKNKVVLPKHVFTCSACGKAIDNDRVIEYSVANFGKPLCIACQKHYKKAA